ncbi:PREDICTED: probable vacuolar amino acid transporter YPQ1 [Lupinus angustifolius]|uniref:probable vacuolar amino acid transporter YPQ1 n=1 Tax=Lupinus angustifolius TaxID=3871 RepID=UPI00092EF2D3|nr:PREDICTED: probable vacuolar amino acid transporter YPQ1 [Lupinus angustifolius]
MEVFESSTISILCISNLHCLKLVKNNMESVKETASFTLGMISVFIWVVAEIPQIMTNYRAKSAEGLSITFLVTWIIGDLFNFFGCLLEPATLPTQLYMAVLYTIITVVLGAQSIYYGHIYPQLKCKRQLKHSKHEQVETPTNVAQSNRGEEKASDGEESNVFDDYNKGTGRSSPIPFPAHPRGISTGRELFYQSARYLSKSHTPTAGSLLAQRVIPSSPTLDSIQENLLGPAAATRSAPALKIKNTLCLVSILTILGGINMLQSLDRRTDPMVSNPRQESVIYVGRKLFQVGGDQLIENGASGGSGIGTFLGWIMTFIYLGGRLPQICLNIRRGHAEGLNPLMFLFALIGNATYVASILMISLDWSKLKPNLPWLVDSGGCVLLDFFILMQFIYFRCRPPQSNCQHQIVA